MIDCLAMSGWSGDHESSQEVVERRDALDAQRVAPAEVEHRIPAAPAQDLLAPHGVGVGRADEPVVAEAPVSADAGPGPGSGSGTGVGGSGPPHPRIVTAGTAVAAPPSVSATV